MQAKRRGVSIGKLFAFKKARARAARTRRAPQGGAEDESVRAPQLAQPPAARRGRPGRAGGKPCLGRRPARSAPLPCRHGQRKPDPVARGAAALRRPCRRKSVACCVHCHAVPRARGRRTGAGPRLVGRTEVRPGVSGHACARARCARLEIVIARSEATRRSPAPAPALHPWIASLPLAMTVVVRPNCRRL